LEGGELPLFSVSLSRLDPYDKVTFSGSALMTGSSYGWGVKV